MPEDLLRTLFTSVRENVHPDGVAERRRAFGALLAELRKTRGAVRRTQEELAAELEISRALLAHLESGRRLPTDEFLVRFAQLHSYNARDCDEVLRRLRLGVLSLRQPGAEVLFASHQGALHEGQPLPERLAGEIRGRMAAAGLDVPALAVRLGVSCDALAEALSARVACSRWLVGRLALELAGDGDRWLAWAGYLPERYEHRLRELPDEALATVFATLDGLLAGLRPRTGGP